MEQILPEEVIEDIIIHLSHVDLCRLSEVSLFWYRIAVSDSIWFKKCRENWLDKQNHKLTPEWAKKLWETKRLWKLIFFEAEKEAVKCDITMDILCHNVWDFKFVGETDERIEYRIFCRDFKYPLSRVGTLSWGFAYNSSGVLGVQLEDFAVLSPERTPNWGWKLFNGHFILRSIEKDPEINTPEKMAELNRRRMVPIIFRLVGHTFIIHAALDTDNPTEEQKQEIVNRVVAQLLLRGNLHRMLRRYYRNQDFMAQLQNEMNVDDENGGDNREDREVPNNLIGPDTIQHEDQEPLLRNQANEDLNLDIEHMDQTDSSSSDDELNPPARRIHHEGESIH